MNCTTLGYAHILAHVTCQSTHSVLVASVPCDLLVNLWTWVCWCVALCEVHPGECYNHQSSTYHISWSNLAQGDRPHLHAKSSKSSRRLLWVTSKEILLKSANTPWHTIGMTMSRGTRGYRGTAQAMMSSISCKQLCKTGPMILLCNVNCWACCFLRDMRLSCRVSGNDPWWIVSWFRFHFLREL